MSCTPARAAQWHPLVQSLDWHNLRISPGQSHSQVIWRLVLRSLITLELSSSSIIRAETEGFCAVRLLSGTHRAYHFRAAGWPASHESAPIRQPKRSICQATSGRDASIRLCES